MRDQPFNKNLMIDKSKLAGYKYPTYQHYYQNKSSKNNEESSPSKVKSSSSKNITDGELERYSPLPNVQKKSTKSSLKG